MNLIVAVCVFDRFENIKLWISSWKQCNTENAELVIIQNYYGDEVLRNKFESYCKSNKIKYIGRNGLGYDIGALQDVFRERLPGFPEWDTLMWLCDDTIPLSKDFLTPFLKKLTPSVGVVCMDLSPYVRLHIRTTGFLIRKETALKITFEVDPITTKEQCYRFEHRDPANWFYQQVIRMGLTVVQADTREKCTLFDTGYHRKLPRDGEHFKVFPPKCKVVFIAPIFDAFPEIISSLMCQSFKNWELIIIDDNPKKTSCKAIVDAVNDTRIKYIKRKREANYGHPHRQWALNEIKEGRLSDAEYIVITNADNYYLPPFIERMLQGFFNGAVATFCSSMLHSYVNFKEIPCRLQRGFIDCGNVMIKKEVACEIGWRDIEDHSADWTFFSDIAAKYGANNFVKIPGTLFVHC